MQLKWISTFLFALLPGLNASAEVHLHVIIDKSQSRMSDSEIRKALSRVNELWQPHGIDFSFFIQDKHFESDTTLHVHLVRHGKWNGSHHGENRGACSHVEDKVHGSVDQTAAAITHELGHAFGLDDKPG